jgi:GT2 family glycosyltransferase
MMNEIKFAGFIMTFERPLLLKETIQSLFSQTYPPEKILIVDNSISNDTEKLIKELRLPDVFYYRVGYNSGPSGASSIGLKLLADEGYDWIYWGDDDDPPIYENTFEILLKTALSDLKCGCVGAVGQFFNKKTAVIHRVPDSILLQSGFLEVDTIAGGMSKIVNGNMLRKHQIYPEKKLFFSFEDLDFDLKIQKKGYKLLVDKEFYYQHRLKAGRVNYKRNYFSKKNTLLFWRNYYSCRNVLFICLNNKLFLALFLQLFKVLLKPFYNLRFGFSYFRKSFFINYMALYHFIIGRYGKQNINI